MDFELRTPAVAGTFYPGDVRALSAAVAGHLGAVGSAAPALGVLLPHAGYAYSGAIAGRTLATVSVPPTAVVLGPNHTGGGPARSIWPRGSWGLPGGALAIDAELAAELTATGVVVADTEAHLREHSIEVELPFLRACRSDVRIVPICLRRLSLDACLELGAALAAAVRGAKARGGDVLLVASSDMSHYVTAKVAAELDGRALAAIAAVDPVALYETVVRDEISMCGFVPTTVVLAAVAALGSPRGDIVAYGHSGETTGDLRRVVGYAGAVFRGRSTPAAGVC
jgi:AmmeMemoRadiSam system protein B